MKLFWGIKMGGRHILCLMLFLALSACSSLPRMQKERAEQALPLYLKYVMLWKKVTPGTPILMRIFKEENVLEIWKEGKDKKFIHIISYPICSWSGTLGPKRKEKDLQAPEGFYTVRLGQLNPNSHFYLSFDLGYPNLYDRRLQRTGCHLMVHGGCSSAGCYAMGDRNMAAIYAFAREAFVAGQDSFQVQIFPFRLEDEKMARYKENKNYAFWQMLKKGYDLFEKTRRPVGVKIIGKKYVFSENSK